MRIHAAPDFKTGKGDTGLKIARVRRVTQALQMSVVHVRTRAGTLARPCPISRKEVYVLILRRHQRDEKLFGSLCKLVGAAAE